jgi:hypothetical protein
MDLKNIFKKLILLHLLLLAVSIFWVAVVGQSEGALNFNENQEYSNFNLILLLIYIFIYFTSCFLLYKFKKIGKILYLISFIFSGFITLIDGPIALDSLIYLLDGLYMAASGAILTFLYFTPIKKEFDK